MQQQSLSRARLCSAQKELVGSSCLPSSTARGSSGSQAEKAELPRRLCTPALAEGITRFDVASRRAGEAVLKDRARYDIGDDDAEIEEQQQQQQEQEWEE
ncbi:uncharacterized protein PV09_06669 [Verruconis gallopava]|uniref:Uncharacterized protein n=1 Tax=Verruconis gallopava TaxID=253628 RepID=A0A0D1XHU0_9PEZI|nr:uncharacterized protein PV09_06669 [Verruconis gallopava]KIW01816.1 hypothetical protein PV09_06669 [Verruconis gallopava]